MNYKIISRVLCMKTAVVFLLASWLSAEPNDMELLQQIPVVERAMQDEVDHWGLPFSEQLRRFGRAREKWRKLLGDKAPRDFMVGIQHGLEKIPRNKYWFKGVYAGSVALEAARNEYESVQVAVLPDLGKTCSSVTLATEDLRLRKGKGTISAQQVTIYRVGYAETKPARYPSLYTGLWPDPLLPNGSLSITGSDLGVFWVEVHVPRDAVPGEYRGRLLLTVDGVSMPIQVSLLVHAFDLPKRVPFPVAVWTVPKWPSGKEMSPADNRLLWGELLEHGVDPLSIGKDFVSLESTDYRVLDENLEFGFSRGLQVFEVPNPGNAVERLRPLVEHLRKKGWLSKAIVYSNQDEPSKDRLLSRNIPYRRSLKSLFPDLRVFLASRHYADIAQACDIWMTDVSTCPRANFAREHHEPAALWFYYCHMPLHADFIRPLVQAPNMEIDNEAIEHRLTLWLAWKYRAAGMFIWAGNNEWVNKDVDQRHWQETNWKLSDTPYKYPLGGLHNGNGYLVYPGPAPSIRLKQLRDGLEDYGYFLELQNRMAATKDVELKKRAEALCDVPPAVLIDPHYFNRDPSTLFAVRAEMARLIDALGTSSIVRRNDAK